MRSPAGPLAWRRPAEAGGSPLLRARLALVFAFAAFTGYPVSIAGWTAYKVAGGLLAAFTAVETLSQRRNLDRLRLPSVCLLALLVAGLLGGLQFGAIDVEAASRILMNAVLALVVALSVGAAGGGLAVPLGLAAGAVASTVVGLGTPDFVDVEERVAGVQGNANGFAQVAVIGFLTLIGLAARCRGLVARAALLGLALLCLGGLVKSGSRGPSLGLVAGVAGLLGSRVTRKHALLSLPLLVAAPLFAGPLWRWEKLLEAEAPFESGEMKYRVELLQNGLRLYLEKPLFGVGFGNVVPALSLTDATSVRVTHNFLAQLIAETGTLGLVAFGGLVAMGLRAAYAVRAASSGEALERGVAGALLLSYIVAQLSSGNYQHAPWYLLFGFAYGITPVAARETPRVTSGGASAASRRRAAQTRGWAPRS